MIRRFNYTGRQRIAHKTVRINIKEDRTFDVTWNLSEYNLPDSGVIYLEAYSSGSADVIRFMFGTVGKPDNASGILNDISKEAATFDFKVVDESQIAGKLLALAESIKPVSEEDEESGQQSILPVNPVDLGARIWRLNFVHSRPWLEVNNQIPNIMTIIKEDRKFFALAYPSIIQQILTKILIINGFYDAESDPGDWQVQWLKWAIHWHPDNAPPKEGDLFECSDDWCNWIEQVVNSFCNKHNMRDKFIYSDGEERIS
jgi:hypothetical protein